MGRFGFPCRFLVLEPQGCWKEFTGKMKTFILQLSPGFYKKCLECLQDYWALMPALCDRPVLGTPSPHSSVGRR